MKNLNNKIFLTTYITYKNKDKKRKDEKQKLGLVLELRLRWNKIQKLKFNIESKENFTQIGSRLRFYLGKIVLLSFQNLFYFHIDVLLVSIR